MLPPPWIKVHHRFSDSDPNDFYRDLFSFKINQTNVHLIGVRHGAEKSTQLVQKTIDYIKPSAVLLEIDNNRAAKLVHLERNYSKVEAHARNYAKWFKNPDKTIIYPNVAREYNNLIEILKLPKFMIHAARKLLPENDLVKILVYLFREA